jgi:hypothetical protein
MRGLKERLEDNANELLQAGFLLNVNVLMVVYSLLKNQQEQRNEMSL